MFAPAAAHLCNGVDLAELGDLIEPALLLPGILPLVRTEDDEIVAEVLWVDRYGNAQLNVEPSDLDGWGDAVSVRFGDEVRTGHRAGSFDAIGDRVGLVVDGSGLLSSRWPAARPPTSWASPPAPRCASVRLGDGGDAAGPGVSTPVQLRPRP